MDCVLPQSAQGSPLVDVTSGYCNSANRRDALPPSTAKRQKTSQMITTLDHDAYLDSGMDFAAYLATVVEQISMEKRCTYDPTKLKLFDKNSTEIYMMPSIERWPITVSYSSSPAVACLSGLPDLGEATRDDMDEWWHDWESLDCCDESYDSSCELDDQLSGAEDIPSSDPQDVSEYAADIYGKLGQHEATDRRPQPQYMDNQPDLSAAARAAVVDWLIGVQVKYGLKTDTLFLSVSLLDAFLSKKRVEHKDLQLVACASAFVAAKFEEIDPPEVRDFVDITGNICSKEDILKMEVRMLSVLGFCLCKPTAASYLGCYQLDCDNADVHRALLQYVLELALLELNMLRFSPSVQAAAASLVSCYSLKLRPAQPALLADKGKRTRRLVRLCAKEMRALLRNAEGHSEVRRKFSSPEFHCVAKRS